ncbi:MAG TPA: bifunctional metallophosphatase/5'-nucleotidase [Lactobacillus sp.]|nr:bifunctional metallophosphatase/5'-nucleotidase [Lactobacillus sp.]
MKLTILSTSDIHGYLYPTDFRTSHQQSPLGLARAATVITNIKAHTAPTDMVLTIENGDFIQGSPLTYYLNHFEQTSAPLLSHVASSVGYDAGILGNHEFNYGRHYMEHVLSDRTYPILCANILDQDGQPYFGKPYQIYTHNGLKVAILGLTTAYISHWEPLDHIQGLSFVSAVQAAKNYLPKLHKLADVVVIAYHGGFECDLENDRPTELATGENEASALSRLPGVDALVTGHQHRTIATHVNGVPTTQPGYRGANVGRIDLTIEQSKVTHSEATLIPTAIVAPQLNLIQPIKNVEKSTERWLDTNIGQLTGEAKIKDPLEARLHGHPYLDFINQVQMDATGTDLSCTALFTNEVSGLNHDVSMRDVEISYPYPNTLAVLEITGADLRTAIEQCAHYWQWDGSTVHVSTDYTDPKVQHYNYDLFAGIDYTIDVNKPLDARVTHLTYHDHTVKNTDRLHIVLNQYRAIGGGEFHMFSAEKIIKEIPVDMTELIARYFASHRIVTPEQNGHYQVVANGNPL